MNRPEPPDASTLAGAPRRQPLRVVGIHGNRRLVHRLAALGVVPGAVVTVLRGTGAIVIAIGDGRLAIGADAASAVVVEEAAA